MDRLDNPVRGYAWGSAGDIPGFLGRPAGHQPVAELWMGAHPGGSSRVVRGGRVRSLAEVIAAAPLAELGPQVAARYGPRLPFLFKLLSAARPLSLQVHPDRARARAGYAARQRGGGGDYADDNHKPELICALRDGFAALCGFRPLASTRELLAELAVPELAGFAAQLGGGPAEAAGRLRRLVTGLLAGHRDPAPAIAALRAACERLAQAGGPWAVTGARYAGVAAAYPADPGVLVALLLNHAELAAGEAIFVGAGVAHCYLNGFGAELMAASDNVLRAGLTPKPVNVPELLAVLDFTPAPPLLLRPQPDGAEETYPAPVPDFRLARRRLASQPAPLPGGRPQILLCTEGTVLLRDPGGRQLRLRRGESAYLPATDTSIQAAGPATILRATVGD